MMTESRQAETEALTEAYRQIAAALPLQLVGSFGADVMLVKGIAGLREQAGEEPFSGEDGIALSAALASLGWEAGEWCGVLADPAQRGESETGDATETGGAAETATAEAATATALRLVVESCDPLLVIALDDKAAQLLMQAYCEITDELLSNWHPGEPATVLGKQFLALSGFEASLSSEEAKQRVWAQLKAGAKAGIVAIS